MPDDLTNIDNPANGRDDHELRNMPHVTPIPPESEAEDLFDDTADSRQCGDCPCDPSTAENIPPRQTPARPTRRNP
jgi:hypothetical protein